MRLDSNASGIPRDGNCAPTRAEVAFLRDAKSTAAADEVRRMAVLEPDGDPLRPERSCDLGGVYPRAVVKLARNHCLLSNCGNPVGAVVEAMAGAAEFRRHGWSFIGHDAGAPQLHAGLGPASAL